VISGSPTTDSPTHRTPPEWDPLRIVTSLLAAVPEDLERFERLCGEVQDWEQLFECAEAQGVAGVIWYYLAQPGMGVTLELKKQAGRRLAVRWLLQTRHRAALVEALMALDAVGVRAVLLKGLLLGDRLYPEPSLRPAGDIDLLVSQTDLDPAIAALESIGYVAESGLLARYYRENHHHLHLSRPQTPILELHFRATTGFGVIVPAEEFLSRAVPYRVPEGTTAWLLSPEDELLYLAVHAARHLFETLMWLYDLKLFLRRYPDLDWTLVSARARSLGVVGALSLTFEALDRRLSTPVPQRKDFVPPRRILARLAWPVIAITARQPKGSRREKASQILYRALLCDHPASSLWFFRHRLLRFARRRAQRYLPKVVPEAWSR
jgi:hypothetical protein